MSMLGFSCTVMNTWEGELLYALRLCMYVLLSIVLIPFAGCLPYRSRTVVSPVLSTPTLLSGLALYVSS